jgi:tRNA (guanine-N7-)-methyltransferase
VALLPRLALPLTEPAPDPLGALFDPPRAKVWLEIGFGAGEHLLAQATANATVGFIGCEPFEGGIAKVLAGVEAHALSNVRLHAGDGRHVLRWLPPASLGRAFILFPDPWPKRRHLKRRLLNAATLGLLARVLEPAAELRLASDDADYVEAMLAGLAGDPAFEVTSVQRRRPADWPPTRYEGKAKEQGRSPRYILARRR